RVRDFVHVDDVVRAWQLALDGSASGVFNLGGGKATTVRALIASLLEACGLPEDHPVDVRTGTPGDQQAMTADMGGAARTLGWEPRVGLREGLSRMVAWARAKAARA